MDKDGEDMGNARAEIENARRLLGVRFYMPLHAQLILQAPNDPSSSTDASAPLSPNSPLPSSKNYVISSSASSSQLSSDTSTEDPPILQDNVAQEVDDPNNSCIGDLLNWFIERCCRCCSRSPFPKH